MPSENKHKNKTTILVIFLMIAILLAVSCKECPTEPHYDIYLAVEDVFCTSVTLTVTLPDSGGLNHFAIDRNDSTVITLTCMDDDTLITDEGLKPNTDYSYTVRFLKDGKTKAESDPVSVHTLPTTSHDFIWEIDTLGNYGSYLKDAWIVDENNIWVVGALIIDDSTSQYSGQQNYNVAIWNGSIWEYKLIGAPGVTCDGVFYFATSNIWIATGIIYHWNGNDWVRYHLWDMGILGNDDGGVEHIWASSPDDIYFVGSKGSIVHYNGSSFTKMESGTDVDLLDIWGIDENNIWTCGYTQTVGTVILNWNGKKWNQFHSLSYSDYTNLNPNRISGPIVSVWTDSPNYLWAITYWGLYRIDTKDSEKFSRYPDQNAWNGYILTIRGNNSRDILFSGHESAIWHYNGQELHYYSEINDNIIFYGMDYKDDLVCVVGTEYGAHRAIIQRGHR